MSSSYDWVGKQVRIQLYDRAGRLLGAIEGRVADVSENVPVGKDPEGRDIRKDLAYVVDITPGKAADGTVQEYTNSAGDKSEGWFALQDMEVIQAGPAGFNLNMN